MLITYIKQKKIFIIKASDRSERKAGYSFAIQDFFPVCFAKETLLLCFHTCIIAQN